MRVRSKGSLKTTTYTYNEAMYQSCSQTSWTLLSTQPHYATGDYLVTSDVVTPNFHRRRAAGEVFFNPFRSERLWTERTPGSDLAYHTTSTITCGSSKFPTSYRARTAGGSHVEAIHQVIRTGGLIADKTPGLLSLVSSSELSDMFVEASTGVLNDRGRSDQNLWETLAEADKLHGTFTGIFRDTLRTFRSRNLKQFLDGSTQAYLAYRYGIKPLISDVTGALDGFTKATGRIRKTSRSSVKTERFSTSLATMTGSLNFTIQEKYGDSISIRAMSLDESVQDRAFQLGLSGKDLLTLPWELLRYSFVLDWFANVGDFIGSMVPLVNWSQLGSCTSIKRQQWVEIQGVQTSCSSGYTLDSPLYGGYKLHHDTVERSTGLRYPSVVVRSDFRFSKLTRCLDAFSLLYQQLSKR